MEKEEEEALFKESLAVWGAYAQIDLCIEEMSELTQALCKIKRHIGLHELSHIKAEMADVQIMLQEMEILFNCKEDVVTIRSQKLKRLEERLKIFKKEKEK